MYNRSEHAAAIVRGSMSGSLLDAALLLVVGFLFFNSPDFSDNQNTVDHAVDILVWALRAGGCLAMVAAILCWTGRPWVLLFDSAVSLSIGIAVLVPALIVLVDGSVIAIVVGLFGVMSLYNARSTWSNYHLASAFAARMSSVSPLPDPPSDSPPALPDPQAKAEAMERLLSTKQARPAVPAKVDFRRKDEPVPDGFLAELGREQEPKRE